MALTRAKKRFKKWVITGCVAVVIGFIGVMGLVGLEVLWSVLTID